MPLLGAEFVPKLDEGAIALQAWRLPSVSLEESVRQTGLIERVLKRFPEVTTVVSKTGRAEIATDPMGVEISRHLRHAQAARGVDDGGHPRGARRAASMRP